MKDSMAHVHLMCEDWKRELKYFKQEMTFFRGKLDEVASKNTNMDVLAQVEHFENKFLIMSGNINEAMHDVKLKSKSITERAEAQPNYINVKMIGGREEIQDEMDMVSKDFYQTKKDYYRFLADVL